MDMAYKTTEAGKTFVQMVDEVWAEEPGVQVRAIYQGGTVLVEIVKDGAVITQATLGEWQWDRLHKIEVS